MSRSDLMTCFWSALALMLGTLLGLYYLVGLYLSRKIGSYGVETGWLLLALVPGTLVGITLIILGRRSGYWFWLFLPGVLVWTARPWPRGCCEWELLGAWPYLAAYGWTIISAVRTETGLPPAAIVGIVGTLVVLLLCALITGRTIRQAKRDFAAGMRDGALQPGTASRGGLPQASWASAQEVRNRFDHPGGIVLGEHTNPMDDTPDFTPDRPRTWARRQGRGRLITMNPADGNGHVLVLAASAGYKTSGIVIPNILHYDGPLVVFDPKGDLYARTKDARRAMGYSAVVIDAQNGFDPFKMIAPLAAQVPSVFHTMAKTLMPLKSQTSTASEFFHDMTVSLFAALTAHFIIKNEANVAQAISHFINRKREDVIEEAQDIAKKYSVAFIKHELDGLAAVDDRTFPGLVKGISNKLSFIQFPDIANYATSRRSPQDHLAALGPKNDIYISIPGLSLKDFAPFPRLLIGSMFVVSELLEQPDRPRARRLFLIDEARVLGGMDVLNNVRDAGRSIGMHLMLIYQNLGQLNEAWGGQAGADAWVDSCEARVVSAVGSSRTAADISVMLGNRTIRVTTGGSSSQSQVMSPMGGSMGSSENEQLREVPLMTQAALGQLPGHGSVIFTRRCKPILATKAIYFTRKDMQDRVKSPESVQDELDVTRRREAVLQGMQNKTAAPDTTETTQSQPHDPEHPDQRGPEFDAQEAPVSPDNANSCAPDGAPPVDDTDQDEPGLQDDASPGEPKMARQRAAPGRAPSSAVSGAAQASVRPKRRAHPQSRLSADALRPALLARAEDLFRAAFGDPVRPNAREWRPKGRPAIAMHIRGPKRGVWFNHSSDEGGDLFDLVAIVFCNLPNSKADFPKVLEEVARFTGTATASLPQPTPRPRAEDTDQDGARDAGQKQIMVDALRALAQPVAGSPAVAYLAARALTRLPAEDLGWLPPMPTQVPAGSKIAIRSPQCGALVVWARGRGGNVTGGQRILINGDGTAVVTKVPKPAFGTIGGCPARFAAWRQEGSRPGPLIVAEGSETALSIWQATGHETWAVFGVSGWRSAPIPNDRPVILAPDRDAPDSPAGRAFRAALAHHVGTNGDRRAGCELRVASAPEPAGSKRDLNDTDQRAGPEAVRAAIAAARPPGALDDDRQASDLPLQDKPRTAPPGQPTPLRITKEHGSVVRAGVKAARPPTRDSHARTLTKGNTTDEAKTDAQAPQTQQAPRADERDALAVADEGVPDVPTGAPIPQVRPLPGDAPVPAPAKAAQAAIARQSWDPDLYALWGRLGVPFGDLDFGRNMTRTSTRPALLRRTLRPLRDLWFRWMLPLGDVPLNLSLDPPQIIAHPRTATDGLKIVRIFDLIDWYLSHPDGRYELYDLKCRRRQFDGFEWRLHLLRCWVRNEPCGLPPGLRPSTDYPDHDTLRARISPATASFVPGPARYDTARNAVPGRWFRPGHLSAIALWTGAEVGPIPLEQPPQLIFEHVPAVTSPDISDDSDVMRWVSEFTLEHHFVDALLRHRGPPQPHDMKFLDAWPEIPRDYAGVLSVPLTGADIPLNQWTSVVWVDRVGSEWRLFRQAIYGLTGYPLGAACTWPITARNMKWIARPIKSAA